MTDRQSANVNPPQLPQTEAEHLRDELRRERLDRAACMTAYQEWRKAAEAICDLLGPAIDYEALSDVNLSATITLRIAEKQTGVPICPPHFSLVEKHPEDYRGRCVICERNKFSEALNNAVLNFAEVLDDRE
jgi:hypothetical protein